MKTATFCLVFASCICPPASAEIAYDEAVRKNVPSSVSAVSEEIELAEWSLKHSSVAIVNDSSALDISLTYLGKAREELAAGNVRTAQDLLRHASQPLVRMNPAAMTGRHPDQRSLVRETRQTLESIADAAESIAMEKHASPDFVFAARAALLRGDALLAAGQVPAALEVLRQAHRVVSQRVADLRAGELFYIPATVTATDEAWRDGLRRIDERREISRYILLEAQAEGIDIVPLQQGTKNAEALVSSAAALAAEQRWDLALAALDSAYVEFEQSWRAVGVEW